MISGRCPYVVDADKLLLVGQSLLVSGRWLLRCPTVIGRRGGDVAAGLLRRMVPL